MKDLGRLAALAALATFGLTACAAEPPGDDADDNKQELADGVDETVTPGNDGVDEPSPVSISCTYPAANGVAQGQVVPPTGWDGYAPGATEARRIDISEFYDCVGSKSVHAIMYDTSQFG
jgi:hypothetical protein